MALIEIQQHSQETLNEVNNPFTIVDLATGTELVTLPPAVVAGVIAVGAALVVRPMVRGTLTAGRTFIGAFAKDGAINRLVKRVN